jgi:alpha-1,2-mannosyltransferase
MVWSHWMYQTWSPLGGYGAPEHYASTASHTSVLDHLRNEAGLWFALDRGLPVWTPVLVLLLPAVVRGWRLAPDWTRLLAVGGIGYLLAQGVIDVFDGGDAFYGYRLALETLTCLVPLYAVSARHAGRVARRLAPAVLGLQLAAFSVGGATSRFYLSRKHAWTQNAFVNALHEFPVLWVYLAICVLAAFGVAMLVRDLGRRTSA